MSSATLPRMPAGKQKLQDVLACILVELFIGDVVSLVWKKFGDDIELWCKDEDPAVARLGKKRKKAYLEWSKVQHPLAMGSEYVTLPSTSGRGSSRQKKYDSWGLLALISGTKIGLSQERWTTQSLGERLAGMAKVVPPRRAKAPVVQGGMLHHALPVALERLVRRSESYGSQVDVDEALAAALVQALEAQKVELVPYHKAAERQSHPSAADPEWWLKVSPSLRVERASSEEFANNEEEASAEAMASPVTPWDLPGKPQHIKRFLHKTILPQSWTLENASVQTRDVRAPHIYDTYLWVQNNYDGNNPLHRMALLWSIMFTFILPHIGVPEHPNIKHTTSPMEATQEVLSMTWKKVERKGVTEPRRFMTMLTCVIISFFEPESPLREYLAQNENVLGSTWTSKHGAFYHRALLGWIRLSETFFMDAGAKCINAVMLIRMNLAIAKTTAVVSSPRFEGNWALKSRDTVISQYNRVVEEINGETSLALYNAYSLAFGEGTAQHVARTHNFDYPSQNTGR